MTIHTIEQIENMAMTRKQFFAVKNARRAILSHDGPSDAYEFKQFEVEVMDWGKVQILSEVGLKNDEGTMASVFARTRRHIFVGSRGGLQLCNPAKFVKEKGRTQRRVKKGWVKGARALWHPTI